MACDIHSFVEVFSQEKGWEKFETPFFSTDEYEGNVLSDEPFWWRSYALFSFLGDVRNSFNCKAIHPTKGLPADSLFLSSDMENLRSIKSMFHSHSWLTLQELLTFDYLQLFYNKEANADTTYKEFLGERYFILLDELQIIGSPDMVRVVFWFDN